jgi:acyl carrier protein
VPRLSAAAVSTSSGPVFGEGTVLITGGTGALSAALARHLITEHEVSSLVLTSRRGLSAPGATALRDELAALGATVAVEACDAADHAALSALLAEIPTLAGVIHAAGVVDDGTVETLTTESVDRVLTPKVDAALNLASLVEVPLVLFSSATSVLGTAGQANYAAANGFLDGLAASLRAAGRPVTALSWGLWAQDSAMTANLTSADLARINRGGVHAHTEEEGLALFDVACRAGVAHLVPIKLDQAALRTAVNVAAPLRSFTRTVRKAAAAPTVALQLTGKTPEEQREVLLELVRVNVATVLAHGSPGSIAADQQFKQLGFDSLTAVELRNRLNTATGLRLPATLTFDYPTPDALVTHLVSELGGSQAKLRVRTLVDGIAKLEATLDTVESGDATEADIATALQRLLTKWRDKTATPETPTTTEEDDLEDVTADDLFDLLDNELGDVA